ncbi:hypothetical protein ACFL6Y_10200 [Elusimicrobiota bacterium]
MASANKTSTRIQSLLESCANAAYEALKARYRLGEGLDHEDSIRYYFYQELNKRKVSKHSLMLKCPCWEGDLRRIMDTRIKLPGKTVWLEFAFHRRLIGGGLAKTQKLGSILANFLRLSLMPRLDQKYSYYAMDRTMFEYLRDAGYGALLLNKPFTVYRKKGEFYLGPTKLSKYTQKIIRRRTWKMPSDIKAVIRPISLPAATLSKKDKDFSYYLFFYKVL